MENIAKETARRLNISMKYVKIVTGRVLKHMTPQHIDIEGDQLENNQPVTDSGIHLEEKVKTNNKALLWTEDEMDSEITQVIQK